MKQPELFKMFKPMRFNHRRIAFMGLPLLLSLGMAGYSGWLLWTSFQTTRLVDIAEIAVKEVQSVVKIRTAMNRQVKESLDWYLSGEGYDETQFHHFQKQVLDGITEWLAAAALSSELQTPGEQEEIGGIIILREKFQSLTTDLNAQLKRKGHLNKKQSKEFLQSVGMLEELCLGMNQKIQREIDEVDYAYRQLQKKMSGIPFIQSSLLTRIQQAKGSLEYLEATDEINWESINMINAIHRIMIEGTQNGYPILEDARQRTRRAESQWTNRLAEQKKLGVYSEQETTFFMKKVALLLSNIDNYQREALTQMEQKNFETAKYTVETRVEGALDQYLIPSLNRLGRDAQEKFLLASSGLHNIVSDIQHFVIWVLGLSTLMLYIAGRIEGFRIIINHVPHLRA